MEKIHPVIISKGMGKFVNWSGWIEQKKFGSKLENIHHQNNLRFEKFVAKTLFVGGGGLGWTAFPCHAYPEADICKNI